MSDVAGGAEWGAWRLQALKATRREDWWNLAILSLYKEFEAISERGGVLGAMDTMYQRGKIQDESMYYEHKKHDGSLPLIGVNTFLPKDHAGEIATAIELIRYGGGEGGADC